MSAKSIVWISLFLGLLLKTEFGSSSNCTLVDPVNIMFALDASGSVDKTSFAQGLRFVREVSDKFNVAIGTSLAKGILQFSSWSELDVPLNEYSRNEFSQKVNGVKRILSSSTYYKPALEMCEKEFMRYNSGKVVRLMVFVTDGEPTDEYDAVKTIIRLKQSIDAEFIFVGIGNIRRDIIDSLASKSNQFFASRHSDLDKLVNILSKRICKLGGGITTTCAITFSLLTISTIVCLPVIIFFAFVIWRLTVRLTERLQQAKKAAEAEKASRLKSSKLGGDLYDDSEMSNPSTTSATSTTSTTTTTTTTTTSTDTESKDVKPSKKKKKSGMGKDDSTERSRKKPRAVVKQPDKDSKKSRRKSKTQVYLPGAKSMMEGFQDN